MKMCNSGVSCSIIILCRNRIVGKMLGGKIFIKMNIV